MTHQQTYFTHSINPLAIDWGWLVLPWYWLIYFLGFIWILWSSHYIRRKEKLDLTGKDLGHYLQWGWISLFIGSRLFYILFYNLSFFIENPGYIPKIWLGGMSFHGALAGVTLSLFLVARNKRQNFFLIGDLIATVVPFVLIFGRIANFINGDWWVEYPTSAGPLFFPGSAQTRDILHSFTKLRVKGCLLSSFSLLLEKK